MPRPRQQPGTATAPRARFVEDDGGRKASGFRLPTGDCAVRALAIAWRAFHKCSEAEAYLRAYIIVQLADVRSRPPGGWDDNDSLVARMHGLMVAGSRGFLEAMECIDYDPVAKFGRNKATLDEIATVLPQHVAIIHTRDPSHLTTIVNGTIHDSFDPRDANDGDKQWWPESVFLKRGTWNLATQVRLQQIPKARTGRGTAT